MNQGGCLQSMRRPFLTQVPGGDAMQFAVEGCDQSVHNGLISGP